MNRQAMTNLIPQGAKVIQILSEQGFATQPDVADEVLIAKTSPFLA